MSTIGPEGRDPRILANLDDDLRRASAPPMVARQGAALPVAVVALGVALLGFGAFMWMSGRRTQREEAPITAPIARAPQMAGGSVAAEPVPLPEAPAAPAQAYRIPAPQFTISNVLPPAPAAPSARAAGRWRW